MLIIERLIENRIEEMIAELAKIRKLAAEVELAQEVTKNDT